MRAKKGTILAKRRHKGNPAFYKGMPCLNPAGRPKGSKSKFSREVALDIARAYRRLGGVKYLVSIGKDDPRTFILLLKQILPKEIMADLTVSFSSGSLLQDIRRMNEATVPTPRVKLNGTS